MRPGTAILLVGGVAYALIAASTTPFTLPANVVTGLAIFAMAVLLVVRWPLRPRSLRTAAVAAAAPRRGHPYILWLLFLLLFVGWELFNYLVHGTRANHPTFSSITDAIDRFYLLKTLLFLGWLAGALIIVRRGSRAGKRSQQGGAMKVGR